MKVRCTKLTNNDGTFLDGSGWLKIGREYIVLGVSINEGEIQLYLEPSEEEVAGYFSIEGFEILSNYIPSNWIITIEPGFKFISLYPKKWKEETKGFWEGYTDGELDMVELFKQERNIIYAEEP